MKLERGQEEKYFCQRGSVCKPVSLQVTGRPVAYLVGRAVERVCDISTLSEVPGHSQVHVTKEYYLRYDTDTIRQEHREHSPLAGGELLQDE